VNIIPNPGEPGLMAVNVFSVHPGNQQALVDCIRSAGDPAEVPGLVSMHLLRSLDGTRVINHMLWESEAAFTAATRLNPIIAATRDRVGELVEGARPDRYEVIALSRAR
jgi:heme-degrading monooxygenase HmoA